MNATTTTFPRPLCWCGEPATLRNEATDATAAHLACDAHAKDTGFTPLNSQPFQYLAVGYDGCHVAQETAITVCGLEGVRFEQDLHGEPCLVALDTDAVVCEVCSPFATRVWAYARLVEAQREDREAAAAAYGPQLDGADDELATALDEYDVSADAQAAMASVLHNALSKLYCEEELDLDEHDEAQEALAAWVEHVHGLDADSEDWTPMWAEGAMRVHGVRVLVHGLEVRYELDAATRERLDYQAWCARNSHRDV